MYRYLAFDYTIVEHTMNNEVKIPERGDIPQEHRWDLAPLFATDDEWEKLYAELEAKIRSYPAYRGRLGESAAVLRDVIDFDLEISRGIERLYTYAHLKSDEDKTDQRYMALYGRAMNLYRRVSELSSFITPEIQAIPENTMKGFIADAAFDGYGFFMDKILRYKPHTLSREIEEILAMSVCGL